MSKALKLVKIGQGIFINPATVSRVTTYEYTRLHASDEYCVSIFYDKAWIPKDDMSFDSDLQRDTWLLNTFGVSATKD